jgi:hypothetical protein
MGSNKYMTFDMTNKSKNFLKKMSKIHELYEEIKNNMHDDLYLYSNLTSKESLELICEALKVNTSLTSLNLGGLIFYNLNNLIKIK